MNIESVQDEQVRNMAKTLKASGFALSDTEAIRMAEEMTATSKKVQQSYDQQGNNEEKENSESTPTTDFTKADDLYKEQEDLINSSNRNYGGVLDSNKPIGELLNEEKKHPETSFNVNSSSRETMDFDKSETQEREELNSMYSTQDNFDSEPEVKSDVEPGSESESGAESESKAEAELEESENQSEESAEKSEEQKDEFGQGETGQPKPGAEKMPESTIDLGEVFKFH